MFRNWGFLVGEIWVLLILAALIGLLAGWLIWGRRRDDVTLSFGSEKGQAAGVGRELEQCEALSAAQREKIRALEAELREMRAQSAETSVEEVTAAMAQDALASQAPVDFDGDGTLEGTQEGTRPQALSQPRSGGADDLKKIKGIGPKLEQLCNELGFYHYDQIAQWSSQELAWVNANLTGFKGRATRDNWIEQAKQLALGGETEFSKRVDKGDVY